MPDKLIELIQNNDETIKERVRWAITYVADNHGMSNEKLSKYPGCATSTINSYRRKITMPGLDFFVVFLYKYGFSLDWFVSGAGEPFPGARAKYPKACGPDGTITITGTGGTGAPFKRIKAPLSFRKMAQEQI